MVCTVRVLWACVSLPCTGSDRYVGLCRPGYLRLLASVSSGIMCILWLCLHHVTVGHGEVPVQGCARGQFSVSIASNRCDWTEVYAGAWLCGPTDSFPVCPAQKCFVWLSMPVFTSSWRPPQAVASPQLRCLYKVEANSTFPPRPCYRLCD